MPSCSASVSMTRPAMESCTWKMLVTFSSNRPLHSVCPSRTRNSRDVTLRRSPSFWSVPSSTADTPNVRPIAIGSSSARVCFVTLLSGLTAMSGSSLNCVISASAIPSCSAGLLCSARIARNGSTATEVISPAVSLAERQVHHDCNGTQRHQRAGDQPPSLEGASRRAFWFVNCLARDHGGDKPIPPPGHGHDVARFVPAIAQCPSQCGDRLVEVVLVDHQLWPGCLEKAFLAHVLAGVLQKIEQHIEATSSDGRRALSPPCTGVGLLTPPGSLRTRTRESIPEPCAGLFRRFQNGSERAKARSAHDGQSTGRRQTQPTITIGDLPMFRNYNLPCTGRLRSSGCHRSSGP